MHLFLQSVNSSSLASAQSALAPFKRLPDPQLMSEPWSDKRMLNATNNFIASLPRNDWVVAPNVDEFFEYPCDIAARVREKKLSFCADMLDRLTVSHLPEPIKPLPTRIFDQFPTRCPIRQSLRGKGQRPITTQKQTLFRATDLRGKYRFFTTPHRLNNMYGKLGRCNSTGNFSHFTGTEEYLHGIEKKVKLYQWNPTVKRDYQQQLKLIETGLACREGG